MKERLSSTLGQLVEVPSIYPQEKAIGEILGDMLITNGFAVGFQEIDKGRRNIFASKGKGEKSVLFLGHMDTVPLVNDQEWETPPFKLSLKDGKYFGLGSYDMKGGITAFLEATKSAERYVKILLTVDEENISQGAWQAVREKKGFFEDVDLVICPEPNFDIGLHGVTIGRTGRCVYQINFSGRPEHLAFYKRAVDAIEALGRFTVALYDRRQGLAKSEETAIHISRCFGEAVGMSVCANASAEVEALIGYPDKVEDIQEALQGLTKEKVNIKPRKTPYLQGYRFDTFPYREQIARIIADNTSRQMTLHTRASVGDENVLATLGIPVLTWGPDGGNAHRPNEYVQAEGLEILATMFEQLVITR